MLTALSDATRSSCGGKAATLGVLQREGLPVPDGFVVPHGSERLAGLAQGQALRSALAHELERRGDPVVAARSSAADEDAADASAAGQYESVIGVRGADEVHEAIRTCWASARAARADDYRVRRGHGSRAVPGMAVLVQHLIEADASGVLFTPPQPGEPIRIDAAWGLGPAVVGGIVTPDAYEVAPSGAIGRTLGDKKTRVDLDHLNGGLVTSNVSEERRSAWALEEHAIAALAALGHRIAAILDGPQDVEWAIADDTVWILQARPITASPPAPRMPGSPVPAHVLTGTPGSHGAVTATARVVRSPSDFPAVRTGDILICPYTDPAWTPLFAIAAGVVAETGGALSHAAIVAREYGIPSVLGVADATNRIEDGRRIALDGTAGSVSLL